MTTPSIPDSHILIACLAQPQSANVARVASFRTYDEAVAAFTALNADRDPELVRWYAVRSAADPAYQGIRKAGEPRSGLSSGLHWRAKAAARDYVAKEARGTAGTFVRSAGDGQTLDSVIRLTRESLTARRLVLEPSAVVDAVKSKVTLGRCHKRGGGCGAAFWFRTGEARLTDLTCPRCGLRLGQTTLALQQPFKKLDIPPAMHANEIDDLLVQARKDRSLVRVYLNGRRVIGVPGEVTRDDEDGHVRVLIGDRSVALVHIKRVEIAS